MALTKIKRRERIRRRIRKKISGSGDLPRLAVYRSNKQISAQIINDIDAKTLVSASSLCKEITSQGSVNKKEQAGLVGKLIAERAVAAGIEGVVFDRSGYLYHGRVKELAEMARKNGLKF